MLTGHEIHKRIRDGRIVINPFDEKNLNPNSYNLHLDAKLAVYKSRELDLRRDNEVEEFMIGSEGYVLQPGQLYLGSTIEHTETHDCVPCIDGRSSSARLGLFVHVTAGFGDIGFCGRWTLEIMTIHPLRIYSGVPICQIHYTLPAGEQTRKYQGKYQNNQGLQASRFFTEYKS